MGLLPGWRELVLVAIVAFAVLGRPRPPWARGRARAGAGVLSDRITLALTVTAASAVAAWVATRTWVALHPPGPP